jgi:hypothetical protein
MGTGRLPQNILLLHNNASPHSAAHIKETLQELKYEVPEHPPYSSELEPHFHLFGHFKEALTGCQFQIMSK